MAPAARAAREIAGAITLHSPSIPWTTAPSGLRASIILRPLPSRGAPASGVLSSQQPALHLHLHRRRLLPRPLQLLQLRLLLLPRQLLQSLARLRLLLLPRARLQRQRLPQRRTSHCPLVHPLVRSIGREELSLTR